MGYTNEKLWASSKARAKAKMGGKHSARAMQLASKYYKSANGGYTGAKTKAQKSITKWTKEKWGYSSKKVANKVKKTGLKARYLPAKAWSNLSSSEKNATNSKKLTASKMGKQFVGNTYKAKVAGKNARN